MKEVLDGDDLYGRAHTDVANPADRRVRICADKCATCIFRPGNLMQLTPGRLQGMIRAAQADDGHITCHKTLTGNPDGLPGAVCHGWIRHRAARSSLVVMVVRIFRRVGLLDTATGQLTNHDDYTFEGIMGTWGPGPLDTDTALDFRYNLAMKPTPADREELIGVQLELLAGYDPDHTISRMDGDLDLALEIGLAACALVAEKLAGEHLYDSRAEPDAADSDPGYTLDMLPDVTPALLHQATRAIAVAAALFGHPDLSQWTTDQAAIAHLAMLEELAARLGSAARAMPGHPAYAPSP